MAYQHIERIARNDPSPCMQDIPRTFSFARKTDSYRTLTEQLKPFTPIEQSVVDTARVIPPGDAITIAMLLQRYTIQQIGQARDNLSLSFQLSKSSHHTLVDEVVVQVILRLVDDGREIGRASCRERV